VPVGRRGLTGCALAAVAAAAVAVPAIGGATEDRRATPVVTVADDYFAPVDVSVKKNSKVKWVWDGDNLDTHDVVLTSKHPDGVKAKDFRSSSGAIGITFAPKFKVPGQYEFVCTYHKTVMRMNVKVKK
jgi:plastocyanin